MLETYREVLSDVFELPALRELLAGIGRGEVRVVEVESSRPSPFASSLLFDYIATYMYEGDTPLAERRAQALTLDRRCWPSCCRPATCASCSMPRRSTRSRTSCSGGGRALSADELHDLLRRIGDIDAEGPVAAVQLVRERRAVEVRIARPAAADRGRGRRPLPRRRRRRRSRPGVPAAFLEPVPDALERLVLRHARGHGPFTTDELRAAAGGRSATRRCARWRPTAA